MKKQGKEPWIRKENIKWLVLFFLLAFALRVFLSTMYEPVNDKVTDQYNYMVFNNWLLEGKIPKNPQVFVRLSTFIMAPLMAFFMWFGSSALTGTIIAGCLISSLTIIPLWFIAEHLKINPKLVSFFYVFSGLEIVKILGIGSYTTEFGILSFALYVMLILKKYYKLAPFMFIVPFFSHRSTPLVCAMLIVFAGAFSLIKHRKIFNKEVNGWILWSAIIFSVFAIIKFGLLQPYLVSNNQTIISADFQENAQRIIFPSLGMYLEAAGSYMVILAIFGLAVFYRQNKDLIAVQSWAYLPQLLAFLPLFTDFDVSVRMASYGAPSLALVAAYAFRDFRERHWFMKAFMILLVIGNIIFVVNAAHFQFYTHSINFILLGK